jgi:hypothetical protein
VIKKVCLYESCGLTVKTTVFLYLIVQIPNFVRVVGDLELKFWEPEQSVSNQLYTWDMSNISVSNTDRVF